MGSRPTIESVVELYGRRKSRVTPEIARIETLLAKTAELAMGNERLIAKLTQSVDAYVTASNERMNRLETGQQSLHASLETLAESVTAYVEAGNARMRQMEANLDALIRLITAEHSNGKSHPGGQQ
jgi:hypothetical protein